MAMRPDTTTVDLYDWDGFNRKVIGRIEMPSDRAHYPLPLYIAYRGSTYVRKKADLSAVDGYQRIIVYNVPEPVPAHLW